MKKEEEILIRITKEDKEKLKEMREKYDINISYLFREYFRKEYKRLKNEDN